MVLMDKMHKEALQVSKEILVKFIESGRVSPASFGEVFPAVFKVVCETLEEAGVKPEAAAERPRRKDGR